MLKNSMVQISKTASNIHSNEAETDREFNLSKTLLFNFCSSSHIWAYPHNGFGPEIKNKSSDITHLYITECLKFRV
ncbi:hypothetical protein BUQ74_18110 [Leptospira weilii serovar Heyan]|nr:hypothetical protein BUQ74_18110 [Leptospira weilii serovar Heyan]